MPKTYGEDGVGRYVLWENEDGQMNKKYIDGPYAGEHQGYDPEHRRTFVRASNRSWENEEDSDLEDESNSSGCFIATAIIQKQFSLDILEPLKVWRYKVLERTLIGKFLSNHYRHVAPGVASRIKDFPVVSAFLCQAFVLPAITCASEPASLWREVRLIFYFVTGFVTARCIELFTR
jgi:hypothetical protein